MNTQIPPLDITHVPPRCAPCEHIAGSEKFARKALQLQEQFLHPDGSSWVDITLDLEDGAPIGKEASLRETFVTLFNAPENRLQQMGIRIHAPTSPHCEADLEILLTGAGSAISYITIPKVTSVSEVLWINGIVTHHLAKNRLRRHIPLHLLIETPDALRSIEDLAKIPSVRSLDFGLMDFISHLGGAISSDCMKSPGQFTHPLLRNVKETIALAALRNNKIATHNVTVEIRKPEQAYQDSFKARHEFGFMRMWSIHPEQIPHIIKGMSPSAEEVREAVEVLALARKANWGPIEHTGRLHDRASFRYYWGILNRSGTPLLN
jgi:citrate lyase subunit beta/citryl-CoA lyase